MTNPILDPTVRPQDDFYHHVNNDWLKAHPIPDSESRWGTFNVLRDEAWQAMRDIYEGLQNKEPAKGTIEQQARDLYYTGMQFNSLAEANRQALDSLLDQIDAAPSLPALSKIVGLLHSYDISGPWYSYVDSDQADSTQHIFHLRQSGLTLPNRDYYLDDSEKMQKIREAYQAYTNAVQEQIPFAADADLAWKIVIELETAIAHVSRTPAELRDIEKNYNKTTFKELQATYSAIDWGVYADALGWEADDKITVGQPEFFAFINQELAERPLDDWKVYLKWRVIHRSLATINTKLRQLRFDLFDKVLSGNPKITPLWKRTVLALEYTIGDGTGRLYTERHFPESSKAQMLQLVEDVRAAYGERIQNLDWMGNETKAYALKKLSNMKVLIGYPDQWRDFSGLEIGRDSYLGNLLAAQKFEVAYWLNKLHQPTSRDEWFMTPQTVNAYHDPNRLVICFPAAILQPPFFSPDASIAENLGGIGTVIGHELTHGFDDNGSLFDAEGNVRRWQTDEERTEFTRRAQIIVDQADSFEVLPGLTLRGKLVLGESIADLGGLELALHALKNKLGDVISNDDLQAFFISYATTECQHIREEKLREYTLTDPHPDSTFRVNGILQHVNDFYTAFDVKPKDALYQVKDKRAQIW